jgi:hypothetical protein
VACCSRYGDKFLVFHFSPPAALLVNLFESLGVEGSERIVRYAVTDLDWVAANFTVFNVALTANRQVENHRNLFPAIRTTEGVFHRNSMLQHVLGALRNGVSRLAENQDWSASGLVVKAHQSSIFSRQIGSSAQNPFK